MSSYKRKVKFSKIRAKKMLKEEKYTIEEIAKILNTDISTILNIAKEMWTKKEEDFVFKIQIKDKSIKPILKKYNFKKEQLINEELEKINRSIIEKRNIQLIKETSFYFIIKVKRKMEIEKNSSFFIILDYFLNYFKLYEFDKYFNLFYKKFLSSEQFNKTIKKGKTDKKTIINQLSL